jgi:hypothetical protein
MLHTTVKMSLNGFVVGFFFSGNPLSFGNTVNTDTVIVSQHSFKVNPIGHMTDLHNGLDAITHEDVDVVDEFHCILQKERMITK